MAQRPPNDVCEFLERLQTTRFQSFLRGRHEARLTVVRELGVHRPALEPSRQPGERQEQEGRRERVVRGAPGQVPTPNVEPSEVFEVETLPQRLQDGAEFLRSH